MTKDDATYLNIAYVVFLFLSAYVLYKAFEMLGIQMGWIERYDWYNLTSTVLAVLLGFGVMMWIRSNKERHEYYLSCIAELRKVTWPSWPDTKRMTIIVAVVVGFFAVILSIFDVIWSRLFNLLIA